MRRSHEASRRAPGNPGGSSRGYTLMEIMVAIVVFAVGVMGLAGVIPLATRGLARGPNGTQAQSIAETKMEALETANGSSALIPGTASDTVAGAYTRQWTITGDAPQPGMTTIAVRVSWTEGGDAQEVQLTTSLVTGRN